MGREDTTGRWRKVTVSDLEEDLPRAIRASLAAVRVAPGDAEARRRLHALAMRHGAWDELVRLLEDEVRAADRGEVAGAFLEELAEIHESFLDQPLETIAALERLAALVPDALEVHDRLARLYDRAGAWQKAAEAFGRVARLASDDRGRAALRAAARLYRDNGQPDKAVAAYRAIVTRRPRDDEAWHALAELLEGLAWWHELAEVRGALAARARGVVERAALLRGQARALEQAGDDAQAAKLRAEAARLSPDDLGSLLERAELLARGGRGREAAAALEARVAEGLAAGAPAEEIAALRFRLAEILDGACGDAAASAAVLDELLAAVPGHVPALELRVRQVAPGDPRGYAAARLRHAAALPDGEDKAALFYDAARALTGAGEHAAAARALEEASALSPGDADVQRELEVARARVLLERAAAEAAAGDLAAAERRLWALLASRPLDVDANLALAGLLAGAGRHAEAADHLSGVLATIPEDCPPERLAQLVHRYAAAQAALGDADEAHQLLHEAHRLDRRDLRITLALGESCFARKLWREAALHLGGLAAHPEAARHGREVAAGLVLAAQAETRALRPALAAGHYDEAVRLDPGCAAAWHALAELATERGDLERAADCLEREAAATPETRDRLRLYDALGDLAERALAQPERAERFWALAAATEAPAAQLVPVLEKLLARQRKGAPAPRAETCERLAALHPDPAAAKAYLQEAVDTLAAAGETARTRAAAERLAAAHPLDEDAVWLASGVALEQGDHEAAMAWLGRALAAWDGAGTRGAGDPRRAELWRRRGDARSRRGDPAAAAAAWERAVATAPESDGALAARRALAEVGPALGRRAGDHLRALVEADPRPEDVLAFARSLAGGAGAPEDARALYVLAVALGAPLGGEDVAFLEAYPERVQASDEVYPVALAEPEVRALTADQDDAPLADELEALWEAAPLVCPDTRTALAAAGLADAERVSPLGPFAAAALYPQIAKALGGATTLLYATATRGAPDISVVLAAPPVVVLGPRLTSRRAQSHSDADVMADAELRFRLGRAVELCRPRRVFAAGAFARLVAGLAHAFAAAPGGDPDVAAEAERLRTALPVRLRARLAERLAALSPGDLDPARYLAACERAADRSGLLACGHAGIALALSGGAAAASHLVRLAASARYLQARRKLRGAA